MRASSLSSSLFSSFFRASRPPHSVSGSMIVTKSLLQWSHFVSLGCSEDIAPTGQNAGDRLSRDGERRGSDSEYCWLKTFEIRSTVVWYWCSSTHPEVKAAPYTMPDFSRMRLVEFA